MHNVVMIIPGTRGVAPDRIEAVYASVFPSLVSCLPGLLRADQEPLRYGTDSDLIASCSLLFRSERDAAMALTSREWVELIDETADLLDWEAAAFTFGDARSLGRELVSS